MRPPESGGRLGPEQHATRASGLSRSLALVVQLGIGVDHPLAVDRGGSARARGTPARCDDLAAGVTRTVARCRGTHRRAGRVARARELGERPLRQAIPERQVLLGRTGSRRPSASTVRASHDVRVSSRATLNKRNAVSGHASKPTEAEEHTTPRKHPTNHADPRRHRDRGSRSCGCSRRFQRRYASTPVSVKNTRPPTIAPESLSALPSNAPT